MKGKLSSWMALAVLVLLAWSAAASAQDTIQFGGGSGYFGFIGDDGRLRDLKGISVALQLEHPLDEYVSGTDDSGESIYSWNKSLLVTAPVLADQDQVTSFFSLQFAHRAGKGDTFLAGGPLLGMLKGEVLADLAPEEEFGTALYAGAQLSLWMAVPVGDATLPIQVSAIVAGHMAGIPKGVDHPPLIGFQFQLPRDLLN